MRDLTPDLASRFAALTLSHLGREWPYKPDHILAGPEDVRLPSEVHPIFHGSFDWHSCVHGHWQLLTLLRLFPDIAEADAIRGRADTMFVPEKVAGELAYVARPESSGFSRPYGWAWLLALHGELARHDAPWAKALEPLARAIASRFQGYFGKLTYAIRVGTHFSSAFAAIHGLAWARARDPDLANLIVSRSLEWFAADRGCQAWEPGGDEFLSPALTEAHLMSAILPQEEFADWFGAFLPALEDRLPATLFAPAQVSDRSDGKIAHLDGLNLSRAWSWRVIAAALGEGHPITPIARQCADLHIEAGLPHVAGDYMGEHWLATFALLAFSA